MRKSMKQAERGPPGAGFSRPKRRHLVIYISINIIKCLQADLKVFSDVEQALEEDS